jgi:hypothetical protein
MVKILKSRSTKLFLLQKPGSLWPVLKPTPKLLAIDDSNAYEGNAPAIPFLDLAVIISVFSSCPYPLIK